MKKLENKVAIITGAGAGMGKVIAADINQDRLNTLDAEVKNWVALLLPLKPIWLMKLMLVP